MSGKDWLLALVILAAEFGAGAFLAHTIGLVPVLALCLAIYVLSPKRT